MAATHTSGCNPLVAALFDFAFSHIGVVSSGSNSSDGYSSDGFISDGYSIDGFISDGYSIDGYISDGYSSDGNSIDGYISVGYSSDACYDRGNTFWPKQR